MARSHLSAEHFHSEEAAYEFVEARLWPKGPECPHCGVFGDKIGKLAGKTTRIGLYKCYACRQPFTVKVGTVMESSHFPLRYWLQAMYLMASSKKGISTRQLQRTLGCGLKTAWFLSHRIREAMIELHIDLPPMGGAGKIVEADETYVGGKERNKHKVKRSKANIGGMGKHIVFSLVERGGKVRSQVIADVTGSNLLRVLAKNVHPDTTLMTDDAGQYRHMGKFFARHEVVNHGKDEYVRGEAYTNTAEGFFSILKRGITGVYHHVSEQHLPRYMAEFDFRYNNRSAVGVEDVERADRLLLGVRGKRLTYTTSRNPAAQA